MPHTMNRAAYAQMFGPTVGDKVRLADTDLMIEVEKDFTLVTIPSASHFVQQDAADLVSSTMKSWLAARAR